MWHLSSLSGHPSLQPQKTLRVLRPTMCALDFAYAALYPGKAPLFHMCDVGLSFQTHLRMCEIPMRNLCHSFNSQVCFKHLSHAFLQPPALTSRKALHPVHPCVFVLWFPLSSQLLAAFSIPSASICLSYSGLVNVHVGIYVGRSKVFNMRHVSSQNRSTHWREKRILTLNIFL